MKRFIVPILLFGILFIMGCSSNGRDISEYDDTEVVAEVHEEDITIGELRFLFEDSDILEHLDGTIKAKLAEQEVKKLNIDITEELQEILESNEDLALYPSEEDGTESAAETREFIDTQAAKLGLDPEAYAIELFEKTQEVQLYLTTYIEENLEALPDHVEAYNEKGNELLEELVKENEEHINVLIE
jgi:hypothetical protein